MKLRSRFLVSLTLVALSSLALAACGDDGSVLVAPSTSATTGTSDATGTTGTTAAPPESTVTTTSTTVAPTSTTTTVAATTTTTTTLPLGPPPVALEFLVDGLGIVSFGATPGETITAVGDYLGFAKTSDSGWGPAWGDYGACPGTEYRQVQFQGLTLQFSDVDRFQPAGVRQFIGYSYTGTPPGISSFGIDLGMTVADLQALYPTVVLAYDDLWFGDVFRVDGAVFGEQLWGTLTGPNPGDTIDYLSGGVGCGE